PAAQLPPAGAPHVPHPRGLPRSYGRDLFQPRVGGHGGTAGGHGLDRGARRLSPRRARRGAALVGETGGQILPAKRPDLLRPATAARGPRTYDLAYRPALPAMDDAAR